ncbi:MAG: tRNA (adenosine(37)-N6)-threonylcarbamoyltransferase complex ATPase subunit type 1 TsaE [Actinobacteria bacterium]|jgi:tRNA threonylcarbamoyladenosine biosynthesis protein TsaE|nr:MAG: tRNA (adenosine(37)-N6)-threonylcarbamoyltransferase complex ATPase subunit type 1 TsaE [Actinomycetota bacterium]
MAGGGSFRTECAEETFGLGLALAELLRPGDVVLLVGELGAGKTCFVQGIARGMGVGEHVTSPTFTLMREYCGRLPLYHLDAYRLQDASDLYAIGVDEYLDGEGVLLVEWGDRVRDFFPPGYLEVRFDFAGGDEERCLHFLPRGGKWEDRLPGMPFEGERHVSR